MYTKVRENIRFFLLLAYDSVLRLFCCDKGEDPLSLYFVATPSLYEKVLKYMSEVMITRRGGNGSSGTGNLTTQIFTYNTNWTVPSGIINGTVSVRLFGGGAGGDRGKGGGGGWMNNKIVQLLPGEIVRIIIGAGGTGGQYRNYNTTVQNYSGGGTSSFGGYLSANGGSGPNGGSGGGNGGIGYQFGGGGGGGRGGTWGGGGGGGGDGGTYGGGGGSSSAYGYGSNGGMYGGGGYVYCTSTNASVCGLGGTYGGNGSAVNSKGFWRNSENGTNTSTWTNVMKDDITGAYLRGWGRRGTYTVQNNTWGGGGGFGGNGGNGTGGGGGGYGSNGGEGRTGGGWLGYDGGGGGFGGDGGNPSLTGTTYASYGGGGGYGKYAKGGNGGSGVSRSEPHGGGGGYFARGFDGVVYGGGGGGWGTNGVSLYAYGGNGCDTNVYYNTNATNGGPGICILQYYI